MSATTYVVVYNTSPDNIVVDEEGHSVDPQSWRCARRSFVKPHIDNNRLIVIDLDTIKDDSNPAARMAKDEAVARNGEIDEAKQLSEPKDSKESSSSTSKATAKTASADEKKK